MSIADSVARIRERIAAAAARAGRRAEEITLVAVSKTFPAERIREAYAAGVRHFGENRVQEWESKAAQLADLRDATWHLVGHLQSNKARRAVELFDVIDSVDSVALAERLDRFIKERQKSTAESAEAQSAQRRLPVLIEVRLAPEESKHGVEPDELPRVAQAVLALPHLELRGLMCIPPWCDEPEDARRYFRRLRELRDEVRQRVGGLAPQTQRGGPPPHGAQLAAPLPELSMGMSHDFEVAIEEGATQVRIGTVIFGKRA
ncbi:MAG: YggS family pyridoxal phosphate-dependent enzyme [Candidatus Acidiferrales bacterium]